MQFFKKIKRIPWWGWASGLFFFIIQFTMYLLGNVLSDVIGTKAAAWSPKLPMIDDLTPIIPVFVTVYLFSYAFWIIAPIAVSLTKKRNVINFFIGISAACLIGFLIFIFFPTYMDRTAEGLMNYSPAGGIFDAGLAFVYSNDGSELAYNLFPSYHCLISVYCYLGVRRQPEISKGFRVFSLVLAILICLSTQFTKQHYVLDLISGVGIAIVCYAVVEAINPGARLTGERR